MSPGRVDGNGRADGKIALGVRHGLGGGLRSLATCLMALVLSAGGLAKAEESSSVTLLVPGISVPSLVALSQPSSTTKGTKEASWSALTSALGRKNYTFCGFVNSADDGDSLGDSVAANAKAENPGETRERPKKLLFALQFSPAANKDGLPRKARELAGAIDTLRRHTGRDKISLVSYSAGGVVARAYLQNGLRDVPYRNDVDRLITVASPHMGSSLATTLGRLVGPRATSLAPDAELLFRLNETLALPEDVLFASIIVRGFAADVRGKGRAYDEFVNRTRIEQLPLGFRRGGDQVVHVISQNLALTSCGRRYEERTGRPVLYPLVRVADPAPDDWCFFENKVHNVALEHENVHQCLGALLAKDAADWTATPRGETPDQRKQRLRTAAQRAVEAELEAEALRQHPLSEVVELRMVSLSMTYRDRKELVCEFVGTARTRGLYLGWSEHLTQIHGKLTIWPDSFGRIQRCDSRIGTVRELEEEVSEQAGDLAATSWLDW